jgi:hypothetical protein
MTVRLSLTGEMYAAKRWWWCDYLNRDADRRKAGLGVGGEDGEAAGWGPLQVRILIFPETGTEIGAVGVASREGIKASQQPPHPLSGALHLILDHLLRPPPTLHLSNRWKPLCLIKLSCTLFMHLRQLLVRSASCQEVGSEDAQYCFQILSSHILGCNSEHTHRSVCNLTGESIFFQFRENFMKQTSISIW